LQGRFVTDLGFAAVVFACIMGGSLAGMWLREKLPDHHLSSETKEVVKLGVGLVATMAALVLGLVTASAKSFFDEQQAAVKAGATDALVLDRLLARYGPETKEIRAAIRSALVRRLAATWPQEKSQSVEVDIPGSTPTVEGIDERIHALAPKNDEQKWLQSRALEVSNDLLKTRWLALGSVHNAVPVPFLAVVVVWLAVVFASFGLLAPSNWTVVAVFLVCAISSAAAIFLILEMNRPFEGIITVSSEPIRYTLSNLGL
jgi:hypothetical protein